MEFDSASEHPFEVQFQRRFRDEPAGFHLSGTLLVLQGVVHRCDDHRLSRPSFLGDAGSLEAFPLRHGDAHQNDIGVQLHRFVDRIDPVNRFVEGNDVCGRAQEFTDDPSDFHVIVHNERVDDLDA
jgi:hypothetical protein